MAHLPQHDVENGSLFRVGKGRNGNDNLSASSPNVGNPATVSVNAASFSREWPVEPTCPTVELPVAELPCGVAKSASLRHVAWDELIVAAFAIALLVIVSSLAGAR